MSRRWYIQPDPPDDAADGDVWEESDEHSVVVELADLTWEACVACGKEFASWYLCDTHRLCGICHPNLLADLEKI